MKKLLLMVMACYAVTSSAQTRDAEDFVRLFNDSVVYAGRVTLRPNLYGNLQVRADSRQIPINQVKFLSNRDGFFANTGRLSIIQTSSFAERITEGRINVFQSISVDAFERNIWHRHEYTSQQNPFTANMYYNKGFGNLKKVDYKNLILDMADSPESLDLLKSYKKKINASKMLYISGGASILAGFISVLASNGGGFGKMPNYTGAAILMGAGSGLALGGFVMQISARNKLSSAIDMYNR